LNLFAAFDTRIGKVCEFTASRKRQSEFIAFLEQLERETPASVKTIHIVLDNLRMHKGKQVQAWLAKHPRFEFHHPPVHCSWMNQVEQWFGIVRRKRLRIVNFNVIYSEVVRQALIILWDAADRICGKRIKAALPSLIGAMELHGYLALDPGVRQLLLGISPATVDRLLASVRGTAGRRRKRKSTMKASREVPIRTFADWKDPELGFLEVDFVSHGGVSM
jgi:hypothetical protein